MGTVTLDKIYKDIVSMKKEIHKIKLFLSEGDLELADEIKDQIKKSRKRDESEFISQEEVEKLL